MNQLGDPGVLFAEKIKGLWRPTQRRNECEDSQEYTDLLKGF
jgi:hypothetical protein